MTVPGNVQSYLQNAAVEFDLMAHPHTGSSRETAEAVHLPADHMAKAVVLRDDKGWVMAVIPGDKWLRVESLRESLGRPNLELAHEDELSERFPDCDTGAVPPLPRAYGMEGVVDISLESLNEISFEAGDHEDIIRASGDAFRKLVGGARLGHYCQALNAGQLCDRPAAVVEQKHL